MGLDDALKIVNDPSLTAYADYTHHTVYRTIGEFEFGYDETYDDIAFAFAFVAVEMALNEELLHFVPDDQDPGAESAG